MPFSFLFRFCGPAILLVTAALAVTSAAAAGADSDEPAWVASWHASPQPVWSSDFLFPTNIPARLEDQTVRQTARISIGGSRLRLVLSNAYGDQPMRIGKVTAGRPDAAGSVAADGLHTVTFDGLETVTVLPGAQVLSDAVPLPIPSSAQVVVTIYLPHSTPLRSFHWDGRQTAWILPGDQTMKPSHQPGDSGSSTTTRLLLTGIQVQNQRYPAQAVAVIGDSITDGATASLDKDTRWPDFLAARLAPHGVGVVNAGISGARLLSDGMGVNALARLDRDVLSQAGVRSLIVMLGINDIAWPGTAFAPQGQRPTLEAMVAGYRQLVAQAHSRGIRVVGATLTPFEGALQGTPLADYYRADKDTLRGRVNEWIRHGGAFDAVIDFDSLLRDPVRPSRLAQRFDSGDGLHPGDEGNRAMAEAVDLETLIPALRSVPVEQVRRIH